MNKVRVGLKIENKRNVHLTEEIECLFQGWTKSQSKSKQVYWNLPEI